MSSQGKSEGTTLGSVLEFFVIVAVAVVVTVLIRMFVCEPFIIPSSSMVETLQVGDRVLGEKVSFRLREPAAGDIVTFDDPEQPGTILIKRVIATAGQTVELRDGSVWVDGRQLDEPYTEGKPSYPLSGHGSNLDADVSYPYTVPDGCVWVMGDNRTNSLDARYFGAIPVSSITSRAAVVFWPPEDIGSLSS